MSKSTLAQKRTQAGARMASKAKVRAMSEAQFDRWLADKSSFGGHPVIANGYGLDGVAVGSVP